MQLKRSLCVTTFVCAQLLSPIYAQAGSYGSATWDEAGNRIKLKTVCGNHGYGSISYRECRSKISKHFKYQCKSYTKKYSAASTKNRAKYKGAKSKYCYAARHFKIVD